MTVRVTQRTNNGVVVTTPSEHVQVSRTDQQLVTAVTKGPRGPQGDAGPQGPGVVVGSGAPTNSDGSEGDTYIDSDSGAIYGPKEGGVWPQSTSSLSIATKRSVFVQGSASATWSITHNLGGRPTVTVVDSAGSVVIGDVSYVSDTQIVVEFSAPFSGHAYLT